MGLTRDRVLEITGLTRHQYYYLPKTGKKRGRKKSSHTLKEEKDKTRNCPNGEVVEKIRERQEDPDLQSGYHLMTYSLMLLGYIINHKKTYRLMKEGQLLLQRPKSKDKVYAKYRTVRPEGPLEVFEMDIKQVFCTQKRRYAQILTVIDTFTRTALFWEVGFQMKKGQVLKAWENIITHIIQPATEKPNEVHIEVRNDNGPQFRAKELRTFFKENGLGQVFTHPYTPQENGHIESFHAILGKSTDRHTFWSIGELEGRLERFYKNYNNKRVHSSIANLTPILFWKLWEEGKIIKTEKSKRKVKFTLVGKYQQLPGNTSLGEAPCVSLDGRDARSMKKQREKVDGPSWPITLMNNHRYKTSPEIAPCKSEIKQNLSTFEKAS